MINYLFIIFVSNKQGIIMFSFFRSKKSSYKDFSAIEVDMHSHLIPGVDDGAKDLEDSLQLIIGLQELGFTKLHTTPHTIQEIHPNTCDTLKEGFELLKDKLPEGISLHLSSEYYLDQQFQDQLQSGTVLPLPGNRLLIEFSQITRPFDLEDSIFQLGLKGYTIVLAHPERYLFFHRDFKYYNRLKDMGVEFQVNAMSLTTHYGRIIKEIADKLVVNNMIDFIGTDIHHVRHLPILKQVPLTKSFASLVNSGSLKNTEL